MEHVLYHRIMTRAAEDTSLSVWHIALLLAIVYIAAESGVTQHIHITRKKLMQRSRIGSIVTYHKYMQELVAKGYIRYYPSYHPKKGSVIVIQ